MRLAGGIAAVVAGTMFGLAGCYSPHAATGAPCEIAINNCPSGQTCMQTPDGSFCLSSLPNNEIDAPLLIDARPDNAPSCYGTGLIHDVCGLAPMNSVDITTDRAINTAMVGGTNCDQIIAQPGGGPSLCLIAATTFSIGSVAKVTVTGPNPLLVIGTQSVTIAGTLDASSHIGGSTGPGAQTTCGASNAGGVGGAPEGGGGGGAGGSFGGKGGDGAIGYKSSTNNPGGPAGVALAAMMPTTLIGGCPGGTGGPGHGGQTGAGAGGNGGGAIYIISGGGALTITGVVTASGAGGGEGTDGVDSSGGAGGGGAGGLIGLDAPSFVITGSVFANGGGGGGGGGTDPSFHGSPGSDATAATMQAAGGTGGNGGGGNGGKGYAAGGAPNNGGNGSGPYGGAGGGGGGAGIIRMFGSTVSGGTISPAPT